MITYTEFFLFTSMMITVCYALHWRSEAKKHEFLFKLMLTNSKAREQILKDFEDFRRHEGA